MGEYEVGAYKKIVDNSGLKITSSHVNPPERKYTKENIAGIAEFWKKAVEDHVKLGVRYLVQPGLPTIETHDDAKLVFAEKAADGRIVLSALLAGLDGKGQVPCLPEIEGKDHVRDVPRAP